MKLKKLNNRIIDGSFIIACANGETEIVELLTQSDNFNVNSKDARGFTPLIAGEYFIQIKFNIIFLFSIEASSTGKKEIVKLLLDNSDCDLNAIEKNDGSTALLAGDIIKTFFFNIFEPA